MKPFKAKNHGKSAPEARIQKEIIKMLRLHGWFVKPTHGGAFSSGWPDLYALHKVYGHRWIEVKLPNMKGSKFTKAQIEDFPKFKAHGSGVWVLTGANQEEYLKLFDGQNWWKYTKIFRK